MSKRNARNSKTGLDAERKAYLFKEIREFCREDTKDVVCPDPGQDFLVEADESPSAEDNCIADLYASDAALPATPSSNRETNESKPVKRKIHLSDSSDSDYEPMVNKKSSHGRGRGCGCNKNRGRGKKRGTNTDI